MLQSVLTRTLLWIGKKAHFFDSCPPITKV